MQTRQEFIVAVLSKRQKFDASEIKAGPIAVEKSTLDVSAVCAVGIDRNDYIRYITGDYRILRRMEINSMIRS